MDNSCDSSLPWHVLQVQSGQEEYVKEYMTQNIPGLTLFLPKRIILERRRGKLIKTVKSLFPGYLFFTGILESEGVARLHKTSFFKKVLRNDKQEYAVVPAGEMDFLFSLTCGGDTVDVSEAAFDENDRIRVIAGPLKEMEFSIIKVDRRRQRVTATIEFFNEFREITLSYDVIEKC